MKEKINEIFMRPRLILESFIKNVENSIGKNVLYQPIGSVASEKYKPFKSDIDFVIVCNDGYFSAKDVTKIHQLIDEWKCNGFVIGRKGKMVPLLDPVVFFNKKKQDLLSNNWESIKEDPYCLLFSKTGIQVLAEKNRGDLN